MRCTPLLSVARQHYDGVEGVVSIFFTPPEEKKLRRRAVARGDSEEDIERRLAAAKQESPDGFDYVTFF